VTPICSFFSQGRCNKTHCLFLHIKHGENTPVCARFVKEGYCPKGAQCTERHEFVCPRFEKDGICNVKKCKLKHQVKKSLTEQSTSHTKKGKNIDIEDNKSLQELYILPNFDDFSSENSSDESLTESESDDDEYDDDDDVDLLIFDHD
jgi:hypothetical protein